MKFKQRPGTEASGGDCQNVVQDGQPDCLDRKCAVDVGRNYGRREAEGEEAYSVVQCDDLEQKAHEFTARMVLLDCHNCTGRGRRSCHCAQEKREVPGSAEYTVCEQSDKNTCNE